MNISVPLKLLMIFCICWIGGQVGQASYEQNLVFSIGFTIIFAWFFDAHKLMINKLKELRT